MSNVVQFNKIESVLISGDLSKLTSDERLSYYKTVCESVGLNPLTKPFEYITLNGKLTLYAKRDATDQLRKLHGVSITISAREKHDEIFVVTARAKDKEGREDESTGAVNVAGLKGDALANAFMKAETKAKRRVTLSVCGLGILDESEVETIPDATKESFDPSAATKDVTPPQKPSSQPSQTSGADFVINFGRKYKGRKLGDIPVPELQNYISWLESQDVQEGSPLFHQVNSMKEAFEQMKSEG